MSHHGVRTHEVVPRRTLVRVGGKWCFLGARQCRYLVTPEMASSGATCGSGDWLQPANKRAEVACPGLLRGFTPNDLGVGQGQTVPEPLCGERGLGVQAGPPRARPSVTAAGHRCPERGGGLERWCRFGRHAGSGTGSWRCPLPERGCRHGDMRTILYVNNFQVEVVINADRSEGNEAAFGSKHR